MTINCYNYGLLLNPDKPSSFYKNDEGLWTLQTFVLMYSWDCPEAAFTAKELRLEIIIAATKSNSTGKHTCHDLMANLYDAQNGVQHAYSNICITFREDKPYIVGEKAGSFTIFEDILSNVSLDGSTAVIITTPLKNLFWAFGFETLPCVNFEEEVAARDITEEEGKFLFTNLLDNLSLVIETSAITTNYQEMELFIPTVASISYVGSQITIAGGASNDRTCVSYSVSLSDYLTTSDGKDGLGMIDTTVGQSTVEGNYYPPFGPRFGLYSLPTNNNNNKLLVIQNSKEPKPSAKKSLARSNNNYSVTGSGTTQQQNELFWVGQTDVSSHNAKQMVEGIKRLDFWLSK
jgi:hypothetical protein